MRVSASEVNLIVISVRTIRVKGLFFKLSKLGSGFLLRLNCVFVYLIKNSKKVN